MASLTSNVEAVEKTEMQKSHIRKLIAEVSAPVTVLDTGSPTRRASQEAKAIAMKYGIEFLPSQATPGPSSSG